MGSLRVGFVGEWYELDEFDRFSFGRRADLELDTNPLLHGVVGRFVHSEGFWWLFNEGPTLDLTVLDRQSDSQVIVAPDTAAPLTYREAALRVSAGRAHYELELCHDHVGSSRGLFSSSAEAARVADFGRPVSLNAEQRQLVAIMAESRLRNPLGPLILPTNAEAARRLGWSVTKLNRKLDHLCVKFDKLGVSGLRGSVSRLASDRRRRLVDHCLRSGLVCRDDLDSTWFPDRLIA